MLSRIGKYNVEKELGQGGFGKVYLAFDPDVGQPVAIKKLLARGDPDLLRRFHLEIRTTASLRHKNIVTIYASGEDDGDPYLVMEFLEGHTLKQIIHGRRTLSLLEKVRIIEQVADGLGFANSKGVVHRDVKPENIMLLPDDTVKIMDFGIALGPNRDTTFTQTGGIIGTPTFFAPEQLQGAKATEQTDIFSFGDVCYELLTGVHPFERYKSDWKSLQIAILSYEPTSIGELVPGCPEALETLVHRALAKEPEFRYQTFKEIQLDAEAILVDLRHEGASEILREIPELTTSGDLAAALSKINRAYQLDPGNREVRRLRDEINLRIQKDHVQNRVDKVLADAERYMSEQRYAEAVECLEFGVKLDTTNAIVAARLEEARSRQKNYLRTNRLVSEARYLQQKGLLPECQDRLQEALQIDPEHTEAQRLSQRVREELERRRAEEQHQQAIKAARDHLAGHRFAEALAVLDAVAAGGAAIAELRAHIVQEQAEDERRQRAERFNLALIRTRETVDAGDLERAQSMVLRLEATFGSETGEPEVLRELRANLEARIRAGEIAQFQRRVRTLLREKSFQDALDLVVEARGKFPGDAGLERLYTQTDDLLRAHKHAEAVAAVLKEVAAHRDAGDLTRALNAVSKGRKDLGDEAALVDVARQLEIEVEHQRYTAGLERLLKDCRALIAAGSFAASIERLAGATEFGGEAEVRALLNFARASTAVEEERRFVEDVLAAAAKLQDQSAWAEALAAVDRGLAQYPRNSSLAQVAGTLRDRVGQERRRLSIEHHRRQIARQIQDREWNGAEAALRQARTEFPGEPTFDAFSGQIESGRYEDGWRQVQTQVLEHLTGNSVGGAEKSLNDQATRTLYAEDPRWKALAVEVARRREYEDALAEAGRRQDAGHLAEAEDLLTEVINHGPPDKRAVQMRSAIQGRRSEALRQQEIERIAKKIREHLERNDLPQAGSELSAARSRYPGEDAWAGLQNELDARRQALRRESDIAAAEAGVRQALGRGDAGQAGALLKAARAKFPEQATWAGLEAEIAARRREQEIATIAANLRRVISADAWDEALVRKDLAAARAKYPGERVWDALQAEIAVERDRLAAEREAAEIALREKIARQSEADRQAGIAAAAAGIRELLAASPGGVADSIAKLWDVLRDASARLDQARARYRDDPLWRTLSVEISEQRIQYQCTISDKVRACSSLSALEGIAKRLAEARTRYPGESFWAVLQSEIEARQAPLKRQEDIDAAERSVREQLARVSALPREPELLPGEVAQWECLQKAATIVAEARAKYPDDARLAALDADTRACRAEWQRKLEAGCSDLLRLQRTPLPLVNGLRTLRQREPAEPLWERLVAAFDRQEAIARRSTEVAAAARRVRECLERQDLPGASSELDAARRKHGADPLWVPLDTEIEARRRELEDLLARAEQLLAAGRYAETQALIEGRRASDPRFAELLARTHQAREAHQRREARDRSRSRLSEIEQKIATETRARKRRELDREAQQLAAGYPQDSEIAAITGRIHALLEAPVAEPDTQKPIPWKPIAGGAGAAAAAFGVFLWLHHPKPSGPDPPGAIPVEIRTDPPGASLRVGELSCVGNCTLELKPGSYQVEAQLPGYRPGKQTVEVSAANRTVELKLAPAPAPGPSDTGKTAPPASLDAHIELTGALANIELRVDGKPLGKTNGASPYSFPVKAGDRAVEVSQGTLQVGAVAASSIRQTFAPGQTVLMAWKSNLPERKDSGRGTPAVTVPAGDTARPAPATGTPGGAGASPAVPPVIPSATPPGGGTTAVPKGVTPPPPPSPEEQDWERAKSSANADQLREFQKKYPGSTHEAERKSLLDALVWSKTPADNPDPLNAYLREFPDGAHSADARARINDLTWNKVDKTSGPALLKFVSENPNSSHKTDAQAILGEQQAILGVLGKINLAFQHAKKSELQKVWPKAPKEYLVAVDVGNNGYSFDAPQSIAIAGVTATVLSAANAGGHRTPVRITFNKSGGAWIPDLISKAQ